MLITRDEKNSFLHRSDVVSTRKLLPAWLENCSSACPIPEGSLVFLQVTFIKIEKGRNCSRYSLLLFVQSLVFSSK